MLRSIAANLTVLTLTLASFNIQAAEIKPSLNKCTKDQLLTIYFVLVKLSDEGSLYY